EHDPGTGDEVANGAGDEHLPRAGRRRDPRAGVHGDAADLLLKQLALAGVQTRADVDSELAHPVADRKRGAHRPRGTVEAREEPVARRIDLASAKPLQLATDSIVVRFDQLMPAAVAQSTRALRRAADV